MIQLALPMPTTAFAKRPSEPIVRTADIQTVGGLTYRWTATRAWGAGPCIHWNLLNPSKADHRADDPTMLRMIGFSYRWGFGSLIVTNVYPLVSSTAGPLRQWCKAWRKQPAIEPLLWGINTSPFAAWTHNINVVKKALRQTEVHVAAWGSGADADDVDEFIGEMTYRVDTNDHDGFGTVSFPVAWKCLGTTADGSPIHPLARGRNRVPDDAKLKPWRVPSAQ